ncbi:MAG: DUF5663 domain-containing protein [Patescibacteria group bacterium]
MPTQLQQDILKELGINQLPVERQEEILVAMTEVLIKRLTLRVLENLSDAQQEEFEAVCATNDQEKVQAFLAANMPNYEQAVQEEIAVFKKEMKETVDALLA